MTNRNGNAHALPNLTHPWCDNDNDIWIASTFKFFRNLEKFHFPGKLDPESRKQILSLLENYVLPCSALKEPVFLHAENLLPHGKELLLEHFLAKEGFHQANVGEGFVVDSTGTFLGVFNVRDHIQLQISDTNGELEKSWETLTSIESELGKSLNYSYSKKFGFLSSNIHRCGTGFVLTGFLHLPALILTGSLETSLGEQNNMDIEAVGIQGTPNEWIGDIVAIHNKHTLGLTEGDIIAHIQTSLTKLLVTEKGLRNTLKSKPTDAVRDKVSRSYGLLMHSYQLETIEALNALSACKLGIDLGWIQGINHKEVNRLIFLCRRAYLQRHLGADTPQEKLSHARAELIKKSLQNCSLQM